MRVILYCLVALLGTYGLSACQSLVMNRPSLQGRQWQVTDLNGQPLLLLANEHQPVLHFDHDGHISGVAPCNQLRGDYQLQGNTLRIAPVIVTHEQCSDVIIKREKEFLRALEGGSSYVLEKNTLSLRNPIGITLIHLQSVVHSI